MALHGEALVDLEILLTTDWLKVESSRKLFKRNQGGKQACWSVLGWLKVVTHIVIDLLLSGWQIRPRF